MSTSSNRQQWLREQYKDSSNLDARAQLYQFSTNPVSWPRWIFEQFNIAPGSRILDLGCGTGGLWRVNLDRLLADWDITLSDFSAGMLQTAQQALQESQHPFHFQVFDARSIPFEDASLDVVIANHMLYYFPDRGQVYAEIRRVLKPAGLLYASTIGENHLVELDDLVRTLVPTFRRGRAFTLENGVADLSGWFSDVKVYPYEQALIVPEVEPIMDYILSGSAKDVLTEDMVQVLRDNIKHELAIKETLHITTASGMFEAHNKEWTKTDIK